MNTIVMKFGGGILNSGPAYQQVVEIMKLFSSHHVVCVVSAIGKTTNKLVRLIEYPPDSSEWNQILNEIKEEHLSVIQGIAPHHAALRSTLSDEVTSLLQEIRRRQWELHGHADMEYLRDQIVSRGEELSARIMHLVLIHYSYQATYVSAKDWMYTDGEFGNATPLFGHMKEGMDKFTTIFSSEAKTQEIIITEGFIGLCKEENSQHKGATTTLGREGSDYSAVVLAHFLDAQKAILFKDVKGIYDSDPKKNTAAKKRDHVNANELASIEGGSQVVHPKVSTFIDDYKVQLEVRDFMNPGEIGTIITPSPKFVEERE